ncbi:MAG: ribbon-helix-helix protein, CopG family [Pseudonocardiaceae bacterium]
MTLRLPDDDHDALREQAEAEGRSMQLVAQDAVREYIARRASRAIVAGETAWVVEEYRDALQRLGTL